MEAITYSSSVGPVACQPNLVCAFQLPAASVAIDMGMGQFSCRIFVNQDCLGRTMQKPVKLPFTNKNCKQCCIPGRIVMSRATCKDLKGSAVEIPITFPFWFAGLMDGILENKYRLRKSNQLLA